MDFIFDRVENIIEEEENACYSTLMLPHRLIGAYGVCSDYLLQIKNVDLCE